MNIEEIKKLAEIELKAEEFREAIQKEKERLKQYKPWWHKIFPFKITIERIKQ